MIAISACSARRKVGLFQELIFSAIVKGRVTPGPSLAYATRAHLRDLATGEHRNVAGWRAVGDAVPI